MNLSETTHLLAVLAPIFGVIGTVLGIIIWVLKSHIRNLNDQIAHLRQREQSLEADVAEVRAEHRRAQLDRDEAERRRREAEEARIRAEGTAAETGRNLDRVRAEREQFRQSSNQCATALRAERQDRARDVREANQRVTDANQRAEESAQRAERFENAERAARLSLAAAGDREAALQRQLANALERLEQGEREAEEQRTGTARLADETAKLNEIIAQQRHSLNRYEEQINSVARHDGRVWCRPLLTRPPAFIPLGQRKTRIISIFNLKGGVGKTTLTANLGGYLAHRHRQWVLLLDLDHQRSLTQLLLSTERRQTAAQQLRTIQDFLRSDRTGRDLRRAEDRVQGEGFDRLWMVGNSDATPGYGTGQNLDDLEMDLFGGWLLHPDDCDIRYILRPALHSDVISERYDYVLIDCPPRLTTACVAALAASDFVLIPAQAEEVSARSVPHLLRRLRELREAEIFPNLNILGIVPNMVSATLDDPRCVEARVLRETAEVATAIWGERVVLLRAAIRESGYYTTCQRESRERLRLPSVVVEAIRGQYERLTAEIEERIDESLGIARVP